MPIEGTRCFVSVALVVRPAATRFNITSFTSARGEEVFEFRGAIPSRQLFVCLATATCQTKNFI